MRCRRRRPAPGAPNPSIRSGQSAGRARPAQAPRSAPVSAQPRCGEESLGGVKRHVGATFPALRAPSSPDRRTCRLSTCGSPGAVSAPHASTAPPSWRSRQSRRSTWTFRSSPLRATALDILAGGSRWTWPLSSILETRSQGMANRPASSPAGPAPTTARSDLLAATSASPQPSSGRAAVQLPVRRVTTTPKAMKATVARRTHRRCGARQVTWSNIPGCGSKTSCAERGSVRTVRFKQLVPVLGRRQRHGGRRQRPAPRSPG